MGTGRVGRRAIAAACVAPLAAACVEPARVEATWSAMGEPGRAEVYASTRADAEILLQGVRGAIDGFAGTAGLAGGPGELGRINTSAEREYVGVEDRDLYRCLLLALDYARVTEGAYDPTVGPLVDLWSEGRAPDAARIAAVLSRVGWRDVQVAEEARAVRFATLGMRVDLGGVAPGCALDLANRMFARAGSIGGRILLGSHVLAWGHPPGEVAWRVEVPDPRDPTRGLVVLRTTDRGIAAAGHRERADGRPGPPFLLDVASGRPAASGLVAAVAVADSAADADALSGALFVAGARRAGVLLGKMRRVEAVLVVRDGSESYVLASASLRGRLELTAPLRAEIGDDVRYLLPPPRLEGTGSVL